MSETAPRPVVPYLAVADGAAALDFYRDAFGAVEVRRTTGDDGEVSHAEITIAGTRLFLADEWPALQVLSPASLGGYSVSLVLEVDDARGTVQRLADLGGRVERPVTDGPEPGTVAGWVVDPFGHRWMLHSRG